MHKIRQGVHLGLEGEPQAIYVHCVQVGACSFSPLNVMVCQPSSHNRCMGHPSSLCWCRAR